MKSDIKSLFDNQNNLDGFIKTTDSPVPLTSEQKVILNRKGNIYFNSGDLLSARRLFITTGYSDGLIRIGDKYMEDGKELQALKVYWLARSQRKCEPIFQNLAKAISLLLQEKD
ncbi:MAG: hypothetical protein GX220_00385 [Treponema sp.]|nr:hypothetical protein [Treponema sp.]